MKKSKKIKVKLSKVKYYHASSMRHKPGDILEGRHSDGWNPGLWVFLVDTPLPHFTIHSSAVEENWFVYEIKPDGNVKLGHEEDLIAKRVEIVRCVGRARGISQNKFKRFRGSPGEKNAGSGSAVQCTSLKKRASNERVRNRWDRRKLEKLRKRYRGF